MTRQYDYQECGAKTRAGGQCKQRAMANGRCYIHGGKSLAGIASPKFKTGRWSKYIPADLAARYEELLKDPDLLSLQDDIALLRTLGAKQLAQSDGSDNNPAWAEAYKAWQALSRALSSGDAGRLLDARDRLGEIITPQYRATTAEAKAADYVIKAGSLTDKERRLLIDRQQMLTVENVMSLITMIIMSIRESVLEHCDRRIAGKILADTNAAYQRAINNRVDSVTIDAE